MTLGFMQSFPWKVNKQPVQTHFREKILACKKSSYGGFIGIPGKAIEPFTIEHAAFEPRHYKVFGDGEPKDLIIHAKRHTIRLDPHNRWKAGRKIEMVYRGAGYKILDHFNKDIPELEKCVSVQKIEIKVFPGHPNSGSFYEVMIDDGPQLTRDQVEILAINDGFNSIFDFQKWFTKSFKGKIIQWTDLKY